MKMLSGIKVALRSGYQTVGSHEPFLKATDMDSVAPASRPGVSADQRPIVLGTSFMDTHIVHDDLEIRKRGHE
jgi:hypothetical protein